MGLGSHLSRLWRLSADYSFACRSTCRPDAFDLLRCHARHPGTAVGGDRCLDNGG